MAAGEPEAVAQLAAAVLNLTDALAREKAMNREMNRRLDWLSGRLTETIPAGLNSRTAAPRGRG